MMANSLTANEIEQLRYQIINVTDDAKFQSNLCNIVKPILVEISKNTDQRTKLMELICFINNRIKSSPCVANIKLEQFIELYKDDSLSVLALNFAQMYIKICFNKYDLNYRLKILPLLIGCITEGRNQAQKDFILHLTLPTLQVLKINENNRKMFELTNMPYQRQYIIEFLTLILLTPYSYRSFSRTSESEAFRVPDGMNGTDFNRIIKNEVTSFVLNDDLEKTKCGIVNFLLQHTFPEDETICAFCIAHSDLRHAIVSLVDREAKMIYSRLDWEKLSTLNLLLDWYIPRYRQNDPEIRIQNNRTTKCSRSRLPPAVQIKMGGLLLKSKITLPNTLINELSDAAIATILDVDKSIHVRQIEIGFAMINHICTYCYDVTDEIAEKLLNAMFLFMQKQLEQHEASLKSRLLQLVPTVLQRNASFLLNNMSYVGQLFESLGNQNQPVELLNAFKQCLISIAGIFSTHPTVISTSASTSNVRRNLSVKLEAILFQNYNAQNSEDVRVTVVNFAGKVFKSSHVPSRFLLLEALGDKSELVKEKAKEALREIFDDDAMLNIVHGKVQLPSFVDLVNHHGHLYNRILISDPMKLIPVVEYIRLCILSMNIGVNEHVSGQQMKYDHPDDYRYRIYRNIHYFSNLSNESQDYAAIRKALETYCKLVQVIYYTKDYFMNYLEEIAAASPQQLLTKEGYIIQRSLNLMTLPVEENQYNRDNCAGAYALLATELYEMSDRQKEIEKLIGNIQEFMVKNKILTSTDNVSSIIANLSPNQLAVFTGNFVGVCYLIERIMLSDENNTNFTETVSQHLKSLLENVCAIFKQYITKDISSYEQTNPHSRFTDIIVIILRGMTALARSKSLYTTLELGKLSSSQQQQSEKNKRPSKAFFIDGCLKIIRHSGLIKLRENALSFLATICYHGDQANKDMSRFVLEKLLAFYNLKDPAIHEPISRTLVAIVLGKSYSPYYHRWHDKYREQERDSEPSAEVKKQVNDSTNWLMDKILKLLEDGKTNAITRHNVTMWCKEAVTMLGNFVTGGRLALLHSRMLVVLGDKDETSQDAASNVLSEIHRLCTDEEKKVMNEELMQVVLYGKRGKIGMDNNMFTDAELESRQKNQSTYKELCSLATELNQPSLIYSFMPLASGVGQSNTTANAVSLLLADNNPQATNALKSAIPKLFRYRFDPSARTQKAMSRVWTNLSKNVPGGSNGLVLQCLDGIITELTQHLTSPNARIREACCGGVVGLIQQAGFVKNEHIVAGSNYNILMTRMGELMKELIKVMDDTKEETRKLAVESANSLQKFCCSIMEDPSKRQHSEVLLSADNPQPILPLLQATLITSSPEKAQTSSPIHAFSLALVTAIIRSGRTTIRPMLPQLVVTCLQGLSGGGNDDGTANYISQQLAGSGHHEARERWDSHRVTRIKQSSMWKILEESIRYVDEDTQAALIIPLVDLIRTGVGLSTKCGTAAYLVELACHCNDRLKGATGKLLAALLQAILDRSEVVQREMARAIGYLVKYSKSSSVEKLFGIANSWYLDNFDSEQHQWACCYLYSSIEKYAAGTIQEHKLKTVPLIYLAKQLDSDSSSNMMSSDNGATVLVINSSSSGTSKKQQQTSIASVQQLSESGLKQRMIWNETWVECGADSVMLLNGIDYKNVLESVLELTLSSNTLTSRYHGVRTQAALSCRSLVRLCTRLEPTIACWWSSKLIVLLVESLSPSGSANKWWSGKLYLLYAVMSLVRTIAEQKNFEDNITSTPAFDELLVKLGGVLERESNRRNDSSYRCVAIESIGKLADALNYPPGALAKYIDNISSMVLPNCNSPETTKNKKESEDEAPQKTQVPLPEREILVRTIGRLWPSDKIEGFEDEQKKHFVQVIQVLTLTVEEGNWKLQMQAFKSFKAIFNKTSSQIVKEILEAPSATEPPSSETVTSLKALKSMLKPWKRIAEVAKYKQLRESCLEVVEQLISREEFQEILLDQLRGLLQQFYLDNVTSIKDKAAQLLNSYI